MRIGFTGTRRGLTRPQDAALQEVLRSLENVQEAHHGDCVGADERFHFLVQSIHPSVKRVLHPPLETAARAFCVAEEHRPPLTYLARNRALVEALVGPEDVLVACPNEPTEQRRSGTWSTVRYASGLGKRVLLVLPRGLVVPTKGRKA
jgi:hypothetical protein